MEIYIWTLEAHTHITADFVIFQIMLFVFNSFEETRKLYLRFLSYPVIIALVIVISPHVKQGSPYLSYSIPWQLIILRRKEPGARLNIKMPFYQYRIFLDKYTTVSQLSHP